MNEREARYEAARMFKQAAKYIRLFGWQEKGMGVYGEPRCSMGALNSVRAGKWDTVISNIMFKQLNFELKGTSLTQYNHKVQNGESVARLFEKVASRILINH